MDQAFILNALIVSLIVGPSVIALAALAIPWCARARETRDLALRGLRTVSRSSPAGRVTTSLVPDLGRAAITPAAAPNGSSASFEPDDPDDGSLVDHETGLASRRAWDQILRHEENRYARYGRPVTLLVAELEGFDALASVLGEAAADRVVPQVAAQLRRSARDSDFIARTGRARFVALLPETDQVAAINYAERVRTDTDAWLEASGVGTRLAVGWAQPVAGACLSDAMRVAFDRMNADRHRPSLRQTPAPIARRSADENPAADRDVVLREESGFGGLKVVGTIQAGHRNDAA
jgi:diguanylate cyclase (GGDEF)-like protein